MRKLYPLAILFVFFLFTNNANAQSKVTLITNEEIGSVNCNYYKYENADHTFSYCIDIIYKNQQFIYKQEQDTIHLKSKAEIYKLTNDLKSGLLIINDEEKEMNIQNDGYTIFKNKGYSDNNFIVIAKTDMTIKAPLNKYFLNQLITWMDTIDFGKG